MLFENVVVAALSNRICGFDGRSGAAAIAHGCEAPAVHDIVVLFDPVSMLPAPENTGAAFVTLYALVCPPPAVNALLPLKATASTTYPVAMFVVVTLGVVLVPVAATTVPLAAVWKTLKNDFAPATTTVFCPPAFATVTVI